MFVGTKKIFESYFRDGFTFSNIRSRTSRRIYRLALPLGAPETLSSSSKSRISILNAHLTLFVRRMTSHNSISKHRYITEEVGINSRDAKIAEREQCIFYGYSLVSSSCKNYTNKLTQTQFCRGNYLKSTFHGSIFQQKYLVWAWLVPFLMSSTNSTYFC